jgi:hypothetical protein
VHATLRFGSWDALHAMRAGFEFQHRVCTLANDARDDLLVAAHLSGAFRDHFDLPAPALGETRIHAEQVAGKQGRLVAAGTGAYFQEHAALVVGVFGQQLYLQLATKLRQARLALFDLCVGKFLHFRVAGHFPRGIDVGLAA